MKYIRVKGVNTEDIAKIVLDDDKIIIEAGNARARAFLKGLVDKWKLSNKMDDAEIFEEIPSLTSYYSRLFFSNIIEE